MKLYSTCWLLLAFILLPHTAVAQEPQKKKNSDTKDSRFPDGHSNAFGKVAMGAYVKHTFRIVNTSDVPVEITSVRRSVGGPVKVSVDKSTLNPKEDGKLLIVVDTNRFVGQKEVAIYVTMQTGKARVEEIRFFITCNSDEDLKLDPKSLLQNRLMEAACKGVSIDRDGFPPAPGVYLGNAKSPEIVAVLKEGADINAPDQSGCTALMYASICGLPENVKTLLANGADATMKNDGWTALMYAEADHHWRVEGRREVAKILKQHLAKKR
jgi:hypothetical protein